MSQQQERTYVLPASLVDAMVSVINPMPAAQVRHLLNAVEMIRHEQDRASSRAQMLSDLQAQLPPQPQAATPSAAGNPAAAGPSPASM